MPSLENPHAVPSWLQPLRASALALALILIVLVPGWSRSTLLPLGSYDQDFYLGIAHDLLETGRFTDGFAYADVDASGIRPPGMRFVPLYPFMVAGAALIEPEFRVSLDCVAEHYDTFAACPNTARVVRSAQFAMLAGVYLMIWRLAGAMTGSARGGWIGLGLSLVTSPYLIRSTGLVMTETLSLFLSTAATCAAVAATRVAPGAPWLKRWIAAAGLLLGLLTLTRPAFMYLLLTVLAVWLPWCVISKMRRKGSLRQAATGQAAALLLFAAAFAVPVGPWVLRNAVVLDRPALSFGYASHTLVQRISYDSMTWHEYGLSYLCGLPDGPGLAGKFIGQGACDRFGLDEKPNTFYRLGIGPLLTQTLAAAGGYENHLHYLIHEYILPHLLKHLLVTIPLALRGAWIDHYWGVVLGIACFALTIQALCSRDTGFLVLALPGWFMLAFNGAVAVNQIRYNLMLVVAYAVSGAILAERILTRRPLHIGVWRLRTPDRT